MTEEEALKGFPLDQRTRDALNALQTGPSPLPKGVAEKTRDNLIQRRWIKRAGTVEYNPVYAILEEGVTAMKVDNYARRVGWKRSGRTITLYRTSVYSNLVQRLAFLNSLGSTKAKP